MEARSRRKIKERKRITTDEKIYTKERSNKVKRKECKADERKKIYIYIYETDETSTKHFSLQEDCSTDALGAAHPHTTLTLKNND